MSTTTKRELVERIADSTGEKSEVVQKIVQMLLDRIIAELGRGNRLELREFGVFKVRMNRARKGQNPKTLAPVQVPAKRRVAFKAGRLMKQAVMMPRSTPDTHTT